MSPHSSRIWHVIACIAACLVLFFGWFGITAWKEYQIIRTMGPEEAARARRVETWKARFQSQSKFSAEVANGSAPARGSAAAPVHIVEFVDYGCPYCRESVPILSRLMESRAGEVYWQLRDYPVVSLHPHAGDAAFAAQCVFRQGRAEVFWRFHDRLFATQNQHDPESLRRYAMQSGASERDYDGCMTREDPQATIRASLEAGLSFGIRGTPTFFVNGYRVDGHRSIEEWEAIMEAVSTL